MSGNFLVIQNGWIWSSPTVTAVNGQPKLGPEVSAWTPYGVFIPVVGSEAPSLEYYLYQGCGGLCIPENQVAKAILLGCKGWLHEITATGQDNKSPIVRVSSIRIHDEKEFTYRVSTTSVTDAMLQVAIHQKRTKEEFKQFLAKSNIFDKTLVVHDLTEIMVHLRESKAPNGQELYPFQPVWSA